MVDAITSTAAAASSEFISKSEASIGQTFDEFLSLLTTQLQNQDPLDPLDSKEFTNQLVQFSQVEQQIQQNKSLNTLTSLYQSAVQSSALNYIGLDITIEGTEVDYFGQQIPVKYELAENATKSKLTVINEDGQVVRTVDVQKTAGEHSFTWDGRDDDGNPVEPGAYNIQVGATDKDGEAVKVTTQVPGRVDGVETVDGEPILLVGSLRIRLDQVTAVSAPQQYVAAVQQQETTE